MMPRILPDFLCKMSIMHLLKFQISRLVQKRLNTALQCLYHISAGQPNKFLAFECLGGFRDKASFVLDKDVSGDSLHSAVVYMNWQPYMPIGDGGGAVIGQFFLASFMFLSDVSTITESDRKEIIYRKYS